MKKSILGLLVFVFTILLSRNTYAINSHIENDDMTHTDTVINYSYTSVVRDSDCQKPDVLLVWTFLYKDGECIDEKREYVWRIEGNGSVDIQGAFNITADGNYGVETTAVLGGSKTIYSAKLGSCTIGMVPIQYPFYDKDAYWEGTVANYSDYDYMEPSGYVFDLYKDGVKVDSVDSSSSSYDMAEIMAKYGTGNYRFILNANTYMGIFSMDHLSRVYKYTSNGTENLEYIVSVTADPEKGGGVESSKDAGKEGDEITIKASPKDGYEFKEWKVISGGIILADKTKAETTFNIKGANVEVMGVFEKDKDNPNPDPKPDPKPDHKPESEQEDDDDDNDEDHSPASWELNPDEKNALSMSFGGLGGGFTGGRQEQGELAKASFAAAMPLGWKKAFSFNILKDGKADYSLKNGTLTLIIPTEYQKAGRQFAILAMGKNGNVVLLSDTDTSPNTMTVALNIEGYAMELIYKD